MHRTDPLYIVMTILFALVLLMVLLRRLRSSLSADQSGERLQTSTARHRDDQNE